MAREARRGLPRLHTRGDGRRFKEAPTIFCTQFQQKDWHDRLGGGIHADGIMDRIVHNTSWVEMGEVNMRAKHGKGGSSATLGRWPLPLTTDTAAHTEYLRCSLRIMPLFMRANTHLTHEYK